MNIKCLFGHHDFRFSYNHGMPLGISMERAMEMFKTGESYGIHECRNCDAQAKLVDGRLLLLSKYEKEVA